MICPVEAFVEGFGDDGDQNVWLVGDSIGVVAIASRDSAIVKYSPMRLQSEMIVNEDFRQKEGITASWRT